MPVGTILPYIGNLDDISHGWVLCDGTNGTPDLRNRFLEGSTEARIFIEAGLPNIIGTWGDAELSNDNSWGFASGAFIRRWYSFGHDSGNGDGPGCYYIDFDASRCSNVYGNYYTVQPAAYTVYYIMRVK